MAVNFYNNKTDEDFSDLRRQLDSLPQIKAPDNFEFQLMIKIENGDYKVENYSDKRIFNFGRGWIPATAVVFSAVIFFFVFIDEGENIQDPFNQKPAMRTEVADNQSVSEKEFLAAGIGNSGEHKDSISAFRVVVKPNDVVVKEKVSLPFDPSRSLDLDSYVSGEQRKGSNQARAALVGGAPQGSMYDFDGFLFRTREDRIEYLKARMDSLKNMMERRNKIN